jgi:hypothetical protein
LYARLGSDGVQRGHENVYWFGRNVPTSGGERLVLLALGFVVGVINSRERDRLPGLCGLSVFSGLKRVVACLSRDALHGAPCLSFYS